MQNRTFRTFLTDKRMPFIKSSFTLIFTITQGQLYIQELPSLEVKIIIIFLPELLSEQMPQALTVAACSYLLFKAHLASLLPLPQMSTSRNAETITHDAMLPWPVWLRPRQRKPGVCYFLTSNDPVCSHAKLLL